WEHSREFAYQGQMYDLINVRQVGDSTFLWCWPDREETQLNRKIAQLITEALGQMPQNREHQERLSRFLKSFYRFSAFHWQVQRYFCCPPYTVVYALLLPTMYYPPLVPPPEFAVRTYPTLFGCPSHKERMG
ncbi:MAG: hypothetical protein HC880_12620, partial [Bacteroidia bacterium]|nr:hypothetical protein [Bacteroidia bacterium]